MEKQLILVSHGRFCESLKESTELIMGPQDNIHMVSLLPEDGPENFREKFIKLISEFDEVIVFADLLGGTPCNIVSQLILSGENIDLYAGMNLPMIIEFINGQLINEASNFRQVGQDNIIYVNDVLGQNE